MSGGKNDSGSRRTYTLITISPDFRGQGSFGKGQYSATDCDFEFLPDGSVVIMYRATRDEKQRKFVRYTPGQWFGEGLQES